MNKVESRGCGLQVVYEEISEEKLTKAINELLNNPKYHKNAKEVAARFNDRPMTPQESVVYWTEYVARHKGAPFLRAAGNDLSFIQFYLIDVCIVLILSFFLLITLIYLSGKFLFSKLFNKNSGKEKKN
jgi:glucuronosyltransferase